MIRVVEAVENPTARWRPNGSDDTSTEYPRTRLRRIVLPTDLTGSAPTSLDQRFREALVKLAGAFETAAADFALGFASANESVFRLVEALAPPRVEARLDWLIFAAHEEQFEPGMESRFSGGLGLLFWGAPRAVLLSLKDRLAHDELGSEVLAEMLHWASRQEAPAVRDLVVDLLSMGLNHPSPLVRDAAATGLAHLEEAAATKLLRQAIAREKVPQLREDMEDLVRSLET